MAGHTDVDMWLEKLYRREFLTETELFSLCDMVKAVLVEESNVQNVSTPVTVCGDIHGQFYDLLKLFKVGGELPHTRYVFTGDFVDRGYHSVEVIELLLALKVRYPGQILLIRGNHEGRMTTKSYGFYDECMAKYGNANAWGFIMDVFDYLTISCIIDGKIFCVHGGLSPLIRTLDQIQLIERKQDVPNLGPYADLLWSDPEDIEGWKRNTRGAGWLFGGDIVNEFNHLNQIDLICRSHQLVHEGYQYKFDDKNLVTIWSAPNYCYRMGNKAAIIAFNTDLSREVLIFDEDTENNRLNTQKNVTQYFL